MALKTIGSGTASFSILSAKLNDESGRMGGNAGGNGEQKGEVEETRWNPLARNAKPLNGLYVYIVLRYALCTV